MAYTPTTPELGIQPIAGIAATGTKNHPLGYSVTAYDPTYGAGTFIYLYGVASLAVGSVVSYNQLTGLTTLVPHTSNLNDPLAVSMSANTSPTTGSWFQVQGSAVLAKTATKIAPAVPLFVEGSGQVSSTASAGKEMLNTISINAATVASATGTITAQIAWPFAQGQIT